MLVAFTAKGAWMSTKTWVEVSFHPKLLDKQSWMHVFEEIPETSRLFDSFISGKLNPLVNDEVCRFKVLDKRDIIFWKIPLIFKEGTQQHFRKNYNSAKNYRHEKFQRSIQQIEKAIWSLYFPPILFQINKSEFLFQLSRWKMKISGILKS